MRKLDKDLKTRTFIAKVEKKHGKKYSYSKTKYVSTLKKVIVTCKVHGDFEIRADSHLEGQGCKKCFLDRRKVKTQTNFFKEVISIQKRNYDYSDTVYKGEQEYCTVRCIKHGNFKVRAYALRRGIGCPDCKKEAKKPYDRAVRPEGRKRKRRTTEEFIEECKSVERRPYDYSKVKYVSLKEKVTIICPDHGEFKKYPYDLIRGFGCRKCMFYKDY